MEVLYPKIQVRIPKRHEAILKAIERIGFRQGLSTGQVVLGILVYFLKQMDEVKTTQLEYLKKRQIDKALYDFSKTEITELVEEKE